MVQSVVGTHSMVLNSGEPWIALPSLLLLGNQDWESGFNRRWAQLGIAAFFAENSITESFVHSKIQEFLYSIYSECLKGSQKSHFVDKTPRYYQILEEISHVFPEAKIILLRRRPSMVLSSILRTWVKDDYAKLLSYKVDLIDAVHAINSFTKTAKSNVMSIKYENILQGPEKCVRNMCDFIGLEFEPSMLKYTHHQDRIFGDKDYLQHNEIQTRGDDALSLTDLGKEHRSLVYNYVLSIDSESYTDFGYSQTEDLSVLKTNASKGLMKGVWERIMNSPRFNDTEHQVEELRKQLKPRKWYER